MMARPSSATARRRVRWLAGPVVAVTAILGLASPAGAIPPDMQAPTTPGSLVASNLTTSSVTLSWTPSTDDVGVASYDVLQMRDDTILVRNFTATTAAITGLQSSYTYQFAVRAKDFAGNMSGNTPWLKITVPPGDGSPPTVPGTPTVSSLTSASVVLAWAPSTDNMQMGGYEVVRGGEFAWTVLARFPSSPPGLNPVTGRVTGLTPQTTYVLAVRARDAAGNVSAPSGTVTVTTPAAEATDITAPSTPGTPTASNITSLGFTLTWPSSTDNVRVTGYRVSTVMLAGSLLPYLQWTSTTNSLTISGLVPAQRLQLEVRALDSAGNVSPPSPSVTVTTAGTPDTSAPTAPGTPVASNVTSTSVTLTWPASSDNVAVAAYGVSETALMGGVTIATSRTNSVVVNSLSPGRTYTFSIFAIDWANNRSPQSASVNVTTPSTTIDTTPPTVPGTPVASNLKPTSVTLSWAASTDDVGVASYSVYDMAANSIVPLATSSTTTVSVTTLTPGGSYVLVVVAQDAAGNRSPQSGQLGLTAPWDNASDYTVIYRITSQWSGGFQADVTIRNGGSTPVNGWALTWTFPNGQVIGNLWGGGPPIIGLGGEVTVRNASWNAIIPAGGSVSFGFTATYTGMNNAPTAFTLNGVPCAIG